MALDEVMRGMVAEVLWDMEGGQAEDHWTTHEWNRAACALRVAYLDSEKERETLLAEVERLRLLAEIGEAVGRLPDGKMLKRYYPGEWNRWQIAWCDEDVIGCTVGRTLVEVLTRAGLLKEADDAR
ncbi:MAG: hypothetical protein ABFE07_05805 [Armatimonadia bacterium]